MNFEYPLDTAWGGIATYVQQAARMLSNHGHYVEVFTGSFDKSYTVNDPKHRVNLVKITDREGFRNQVVKVFKNRHAEVGFDIFESPEMLAEGLAIKELFPELPLVVKLHTPTFLLKRLNIVGYSAWQKFKYVVRQFRQNKKLYIKPLYNYREDIEYEQIQRADLICSPSTSLKEIIKKEWGVIDTPAVHVPYPYEPSESLMKVPIEIKKFPSIGYLGRLEVRKGVAQFEKVIPKIVNQYPMVRFNLVGDSLPSPQPDKGMKPYLQKSLLNYLDHLTFTSKVKLEEVATVLGGSEIFVYPSYWENFPNVCLEAMAAGRAVIGSKNGGMADMITHMENGLLVDPYDVDSIIDSITYLLDNKKEISRLGMAARETVLSKYMPSRIVDIQISAYQDAISKKRR